VVNALERPRQRGHLRRGARFGATALAAQEPGSHGKCVRQRDGGGGALVKEGGARRCSMTMARCGRVGVAPSAPRASVPSLQLYVGEGGAEVVQTELSTTRW
jgi:hypothetical protein